MNYLFNSKSYDLFCCVTENICDGIYLANKYAGISIQGRSFNTRQEAYDYYGGMRAYNNYSEIMPMPYAMPTIDMLSKNQVYVDQEVQNHMAPWHIKGERYFAVIAFGWALTLVQDVSRLAPIISQYNGMMVMMEEFRDISVAQNWLAENVWVSLMSMGAYIDDVDPIVIPELNSEVPFPHYKCLQDMPEMKVNQLISGQYKEVK